jgi:pyridoxal phosphate enzyme (YggS family)
MVDLTKHRRQELAENLEMFKNDLFRETKLHKREAEQICLVAVTKGFPISDIELLAELGVTDIGESKDQEIKGKLDVIQKLGLNLHFIGQLQRNKVKSVASYSKVIHSLDRVALVESIITSVANPKFLPRILIQVDLANPVQPDRGGVAPTDLIELAQYAVERGLDLQGLMAVAPLGENPDAAFSRYLEIFRDFQKHFPTSTWSSIGMSSDWRSAVAHGATHLRIGSALLGNRR